jgi:hypothetical protein
MEKECIERYGRKTCLLNQLQNDTFEIKTLDDSAESYIAERQSLYKVIPNLLISMYTVVIIECQRGCREITTVHHPVQSHLAAPPILQ